MQSVAIVRLNQLPLIITLLLFFWSSGYEAGIIKASAFRTYHTPLNKQVCNHSQSFTLQFTKLCLEVHAFNIKPFSSGWLCQFNEGCTRLQFKAFWFSKGNFWMQRNEVLVSFSRHNCLTSLCCLYCFLMTILVTIYFCTKIISFVFICSTISMYILVINYFSL